MAGGSNGYRAALAMRQLTPGLISSLPETAGLPPFISSSTSYPELSVFCCQTAPDIEPVLRRVDGRPFTDGALYRCPDPAAPAKSPLVGCARNSRKHVGNQGLKPSDCGNCRHD
jgi:hypothetical protein